jgi:hypothetical protein
VNGRSSDFETVVVYRYSGWPTTTGALGARRE